MSAPTVTNACNGPAAPAPDRGTGRRLATVAAWFGTSFLVAAATGYAGCPELGAIPSLLLGRTIATACPPLDRTDATLRPRSGVAGRSATRRRGDIV